MSENIVHTNDGSFEADVLQSDKPVLLDFWAEWCGPCKMIAPLLDEAANEYADKLNIVKINIDDSPQTPGTYGIRSIPTVLAFQGGQVVSQMTGARPKNDFEDMVKDLI